MSDLTKIATTSHVLCEKQYKAYLYKTKKIFFPFDHCVLWCTSAVKCFQSGLAFTIH